MSWWQKTFEGLAQPTTTTTTKVYKDLSFLSPFLPFCKFNYSKSHANELDGKVKQQTGRGNEGEREREKEDSTENQTDKRVSNFQIAYRLRFLLFNLSWNCLFFVTKANDITSLTHTHTHYLPPLYPSLSLSALLVLPRWHYLFHVALFCLACKFNLRF